MNILIMLQNVFTETATSPLIVKRQYQILANDQRSIQFRPSMGCIRLSLKILPPSVTCTRLTYRGIYEPGTSTKLTQRDKYHPEYETATNRMHVEMCIRCYRNSL